MDRLNQKSSRKNRRIYVNKKWGVKHSYISFYIQYVTLKVQTMYLLLVTLIGKMIQDIGVEVAPVLNRNDEQCRNFDT